MFLVLEVVLAKMKTVIDDNTGVRGSSLTYGYIDLTVEGFLA
jgi:hypothetical protein